MIRPKGYHFLTAFWMGVLFPVFLGAAELPHYQKYQGPIKPGIVITKENFDAYLPELQKLVPPSKLKWYSGGVRKGLVTIPIVKTAYWPITKGQLEATRKYAGTARVGADNQLYDWVAGYPFPNPKNAKEIAWNTTPNACRADSHDDYMMHAWFGLFQGTKYEKHLSWDVYHRKYRARTDIPPLGDLPDFKERDITVKESILMYEPNEVRGFIQHRIKYWDINRGDDSYAYIPAIRRVRRLTGADLTDPLLGSDLIPDDFNQWRQKINSRMTFRVLEHKDMLVPSVYKSKPAYDYKKDGPYLQTEWEMRPQWVLEVMMNDPTYVYSKRIIYTDATPIDQGGRYMLYWVENYDQKGRLWRSGLHTALAANPDKEGFLGIFGMVAINSQTDHCTVFDVWEGYMNFDKTFPLKEEEVFTISGLLKRAR